MAETDSGSELDAEGERFKTAFRAFQRRFAAGLMLFGLGAGVFLLAVRQAALDRLTPLGFRLLLAACAAVGLLCVRKRRFALASVCLLWLLISAVYLPRLLAQ